MSRVAYNGVPVCSGTGGSPTLDQIRSLYARSFVLNATDGWTKLSGSGTTTEYDAGIVCTIPAGVAAQGQAGVQIDSGFVGTSNSWDVSIRVHKIDSTATGNERFQLRVGRDVDNCLLLDGAGLGNFDLRYRVGGVTNDIAGFGGSSEFRTAFEAGRLVVVLRRRPGYVVFERGIADSIEAAALTTSRVDSTLDALTVSAGTFLRWGVDSLTDTVPEVSIALRELTTCIGGL